MQPIISRPQPHAATRGTSHIYTLGEVSCHSRPSSERHLVERGGHGNGCGGAGLAFHLTGSATAHASWMPLRALPPGPGVSWAGPVGVALLNSFTPENARRRRGGGGLHALYARHSSGAAGAGPSVGLPYFIEDSAASTGPYPSGEVVPLGWERRGPQLRQ